MAMWKQNQTNEQNVLASARVIIVIATLELGGAERQAILLGRHLAQAEGAEVEVWGYGKPGRAAELCDEYGIVWRSVLMPLPWSIRRFTQLQRLARFAQTLRRARPDVILPFMFMPSVVCGLVWRWSGARVCIWNQRDEGRDRLGRATEKAAIRLTPYFVANSEHGAEFMVRELGVNRARLRVIHNGVQLATPQWDRKMWRDHLGVNDDCFLACMVANLQTFKDHVTLLKAWRIVVDRLSLMNRQAVLLLAGRFDETHDKLKALAYDLELGANVRFLGSVRDISGLLGAVDLGVHSSVNEGCPNGVLESMAAGLAVVGTDHAGIREAVGPGGHNFLAAPRNAEAFADRIIGLTLNPEASRAAGTANRFRIESEFQPGNMFQKMSSLIAAGLGQERAAAPSAPAAILVQNQKAR
jgi:glycosyltransferase involved in cell wall biosynthesis